MPSSCLNSDKIVSPNLYLYLNLIPYQQKKAHLSTPHPKINFSQSVKKYANTFDVLNTIYFFGIFAKFLLANSRNIGSGSTLARLVNFSIIFFEVKWAEAFKVTFRIPASLSPMRASNILPDFVLDKFLIPDGVVTLASKKEYRCALKFKKVSSVHTPCTQRNLLTPIKLLEFLWK
jgi:hypothetical protein